MKSKEKFLIFITVVLVITFVVFFIYDRNKFVLERTTLLNISNEAKIVSMKKQGTLFLRTAYQAKIKLEDDTYGQWMGYVRDGLKNQGSYVDKETYEDEFGEYLRESYQIVPEPQDDAQIWVCSAKEVDGAESEITYFFDIEDDTPYVYVYYIR